MTKPLEVLERAIHRGGFPSLVSSKRHKRYEGRPGEIIERLSQEERAVLKELKSSDVVAEKLPRYVGWFFGGQFYDDRLEESRRQSMQEFDKNVLGLQEGPRTLRRRLSYK